MNKRRLYSIWVMFTPYWYSMLKCEQQRSGTEVSRSHTMNIAPRGFGGCNKPQSSLLKINFRFRWFQSSFLLVRFLYGLITCSHYTKIWHTSGYPLGDALPGVINVPTQQLSGVE